MLHSMRLTPQVVFTEEEYEGLFYGSCMTKATPTYLKSLLIRRGVEDNLTKTRVCDLENFIFNSIIREKLRCDDPKWGLFYVYKSIVQNLSCEEVMKFVRKRRNPSKLIKKIYFPLIVGMMVYISGDDELENVWENVFSRKAVELVTEQQWIIQGKIVARYIENIPICDAHMCSCTIEKYESSIVDVGTIVCDCCLRNLQLFSEDCIIKLGRELLRKYAYNLFLFESVFTDDLVKDIFNIIGVKMVM